MKSNYNQLGQYIEMVSRTNSDLKYGIEDVRGCSNTKQMMQTRDRKSTRLNSSHT